MMLNKTLILTISSSIDSDNLRAKLKPFSRDLLMMLISAFSFNEASSIKERTLIT